MAISSITGYLDQAATNAASQSAERTSAAAAGGYQGSTDEEMMDACKKFEAYFIEQVLKEVKKTIPEHQYEDSSTGTLVNYFEGNYLTDIAEQLTDTQSIGLAQQMYDQMKRNYEGVYSIAQLQAREAAAADDDASTDANEAVEGASEVASDEEV